MIELEYEYQKACLGIILYLIDGVKGKMKRRWMREWFKKQYIFSTENLLK
jgi:hypothetical protein